MSTAKALRDEFMGKPTEKVVPIVKAAAKPKTKVEIVVKDLGMEFGNLTADHAHEEREKLMVHVKHIKSEAHITEYIEGYRETLQSRVSRQTGAILTDATIKSRCSELKSAVLLLTGIQEGTVVAEPGTDEMNLRELAEQAREKGLTNGKPKRKPKTDPNDMTTEVGDLLAKWGSVNMSKYPKVENLFNEVNLAYLRAIA